MDLRLGLYYLCSLAGLTMVIGGMWCIYKQKIFIDRETHEVINVHTPLGVFRTNVPALVLFVLGFIPLTVPLEWLRNLPLPPPVKELRVHGEISNSNVFPIQIFAAVKSESLNAARTFDLHLPISPGSNEDYTLLYVVGKVVIDEGLDINAARHGEIDVRPLKLVIPQSDAVNFKPMYTTGSIMSEQVRATDNQ